MNYQKIVGDVREHAALQIGYVAWEAVPEHWQRTIHHWINEVLLDMTREILPRDMVTSEDIAISADGNPYHLPENYWRAKFIADSTGKILDCATLQSFYMTEQPSGQYTTKNLFWVQGARDPNEDNRWEMYLWPNDVGSATVTLYYVALPDAIDESTDDEALVPIPSYPSAIIAGMDEKIEWFKKLSSGYVNASANRYATEKAKALAREKAHYQGWMKAWTTPLTK